MSNTFSIKESFTFAWKIFIQRPWFLMAAIGSMLVGLGLAAALLDPNYSGNSVTYILYIAISILVDMGLVSFALAAHDNVHSVSWRNLWAPKMFLQFAVAALFVAVIVFTGLVLLIIPGLIAMVGLMFVKYLVVDRDLGPINAIKESWAITKGNRLKLFGLLLLIVAMNILGGIVFVGLLVTVPITMLTIAHVYRTLEHDAHEMVSVTSAEPAAA